MIYKIVTFSAKHLRKVEIIRPFVISSFPLRVDFIQMLARSPDSTHLFILLLLFVHSVQCMRSACRLSDAVAAGWDAPHATGHGHGKQINKCSFIYRSQSKPLQSVGSDSQHVTHAVCHIFSFIYFDAAIKTCVKLHETTSSSSFRCTLQKMHLSSECSNL